MSFGWKTLPFSDVIVDESAGNAKIPQSEFLPSGRFAIIDQGKGMIAGYTSNESHLCKSQLPVIIFGDHTRCLKYVDFPFCMGADGIKVLRPKIETNIKYLYHYLRQLNLTDGGYDRHFKYLKRSDVVLPPLPEQRRIAVILDKADELRTKRRAVIAHLDILIESIFFALFGDPSINPKGWQIRTFSSEISSVRYGTGSPPEYVVNGFPFIRATNVKNGTISAKDLKFIPKKEAQRLEKCRVKKGDLIVVRSGVNTGSCALIPPHFDGAYAAFDLVVQLPFHNAVFYNFLINSHYGKTLLAPLTRRAAQPHLNAEQLRSLPFISPPEALREEFANWVQAIAKLRAASHLTSLSEIDTLFASLQYRAFRGEL